MALGAPPRATRSGFANEFVQHGRSRSAPSVSRKDLCPCGAARSARHSVTVEIVGSNPIEDAWRKFQISDFKSQMISVLVEQRSARDPAKVEIVGSNPTGDFWKCVRGRQSEISSGTMRERE